VRSVGSTTEPRHLTASGTAVKIHRLSDPPGEGRG